MSQILQKNNHYLYWKTLKPITMSELTFEQLPKAVGEIKTKLDNIEQLLMQILGKGGATQNNNEYVNIEEASKILSLAKQTIYGFTCRMEIPHCKRGRKLYFSRQELNEWTASTRIKTVREIEQQAINYITIKKGR